MRIDVISEFALTGVSMKLIFNIPLVILGLLIQFSVIEVNSEALPWHPSYAIRRHTQIVPLLKNLTEVRLN